MAIQYDPNMPVYPDSKKYENPILGDPTANLARVRAGGNAGGYRDTGNFVVPQNTGLIGTQMQKGQGNPGNVDIGITGGQDFSGQKGFGSPGNVDIGLSPTPKNDGGTFINDNTDTVFATANKYLQAGSPLITSAQAATDRGFAKRGLQNSSMAATGGTQAAINTVLPMAQQDAALYGNASLQDHKFQQTGALNNQQAQLDQNKAKDNASITGAMNEQTFTNAISAKAFEGGIQKQLAQMQIDANEKATLTAAISSQTNNIMSNIAGLLNNTDIEMNDEVVGWMSQYMNNSIEGISSLYKIPVQITGGK